MALAFNDIEQIYNQHLDQIYRFFYYKTVSKSTAEDLTSETFLQFVSAVSKNKQIDQPKSYLFGVAKKVFLSHLRKKYHTIDEQTIHLDNYDNIVFEEYAEETQEFVEQAPTLEEIALLYIMKLPEKQRDLVKLRIIDKLTPTEISNQIGKDLNYVKTTLKRGMKSLKVVVACTPEPTYITERKQ